MFTFIFRSFVLCLLLSLLLFGCYKDEPTSAANGSGGEEHLTLLTPTAFSIVSADSLHVQFRWTDEAIRETGYLLELSVAAGPFLEAGTFPANAVTGTLQRQFSGDSVYAFRLRAIRNAERTAATPECRLFHHEEYYFTRLHFTDGFRRDGIFRLSGGLTERILLHTTASTEQYSDIIFHGDSLVVTGSFLEVNGRPANRVGVWYGGQWQAFGNGIDHLAPAVLIATTNELYIGTLQMFQSSVVYRYQAERFQQLAAPIYSTAGRAIGGAEQNGITIVAVDYGYLNEGLNEGLQTPQFFLAYTGEAPVAIEQPTVPDLREYTSTSITGHGGHIYVSLQRSTNTGSYPTDTTLIMYDGSGWQVAGTNGPRGFVHSMQSWDGALWAIRMNFDTGGAFLGSEIVRWTGTEWSSFRNTGALFYALWQTPNGLIAGRIQSPSNDAVLDKWDGAVWTTLASFTDGYQPRKVVARTAWSWINPGSDPAGSVSQPGGFFR